MTGPRCIYTIQMYTGNSDWKATATNRMHSNDLDVCGKKRCYFWFHSKVKFLTRFDIFLDLVILPYFNAISIQFMRLSVESTFILCNIHVCYLENAYKKDLNAVRFLINFFNNSFR